MFRSRTASVVALALLLVAGTGVQAASLPPGGVIWEYNFTPVTPSPGSPVLFAANSVDSNAGITFSNDITRGGVGPSDNLIAAQLKSFAPAEGTFKFTNGAWKLAMLISHSDANGPHSKTIYFEGKFTGDYSRGHSNLKNTNLGLESHTVTLGNYDFTVNLTAVVAPGTANQGVFGSIATSVAIRPVGDPIPSGTPEPSTMLLASFGLSFLGASAWRRRGAARAAA